MAAELNSRQGLELLLALPEIEGLRTKYYGVDFFRAVTHALRVKSAMAVGQPDIARVFDAYATIASRLLKLEEFGPDYSKPSLMMFQSEGNMPLVKDRITGEHFLVVDGGPEYGGWLIPQVRDIIITSSTPKEEWPTLA